MMIVWSSMKHLPALRTDIEFIPLRHQGQDLLVVKDALGIAEAGIALHPRVAGLFRFFDGMTPPEELVRALEEEEGSAPDSMDRVLSLVENFERIGILQSEHYHRERKRIIDDYARLPERAAALAGKAYPAEGDELAPEIDRILGDCAPPEPVVLPGPPVAVAAPHIDLRVSERSYSAAYGSLAGLEPSGVLLLGTGHALEQPFCLSGKDFVTPLGRVRADRQAVEELTRIGGNALDSDDFAHRGEHSIEFQLLFLQRLFAMETTPVIPLLCGSFEPLLLLGRAPGDVPAIAAFIEGLRHWLRGGPPGRIAVAGVDLSHVGPKFGDRRPARELEGEFRQSDDTLLRALEAGEADRFFEAVAGTQNRFKVCGFSALWTLLAILPGSRGTVLDYEVWHEEATNSAVSFASVAFTGPA